MTATRLFDPLGGASLPLALLGFGYDEKSSEPCDMLVQLIQLCLGAFWWVVGILLLVGTLRLVFGREPSRPQFLAGAALAIAWTATVGLIAWSSGPFSHC